MNIISNPDLNPSCRDVDKRRPGQKLIAEPFVVDLLICKLLTQLINNVALSWLSKRSRKTLLKVACVCCWISWPVGREHRARRCRQQGIEKAARQRYADKSGFRFHRYFQRALSPFPYPPQKAINYATLIHLIVSNVNWIPQNMGKYGR